VLITAVAGVVFGLAPALARSRGDLVTALKEGAPSAGVGFGSMRRVRAQHLFVIAQVALALVLLVGASLMVQSLRRQLGVDPGFRPEGVVAAAIGADLPLRGNQSGGHLTYEGGPSDGVPYARHRVSPEYFATLGIALERGRAFTPADGPDTPRVAVVSASMARRLWRDRDPVGQRFSLTGTDGPLPWVEVVGEVADVRFRDLTGDLLAPLATIDVYFPFAQHGLLAFVVGTSSREFAIRMALGAASASVVGLVVRKGMSLAGLGGLLGLLIAVPSTRVLTTLLYGVRASDPVTMAGVTALLLLVSLLACWGPARRASRVAPQAALKAE
jgi:hypothetical protein